MRVTNRPLIFQTLGVDQRREEAVAGRHHLLARRPDALLGVLKVQGIVPGRERGGQHLFRPRYCFGEGGPRALGVPLRPPPAPTGRAVSARGFGQQCGNGGGSLRERSPFAAGAAATLLALRRPAAADTEASADVSSCFRVIFMFLSMFLLPSSIPVLGPRQWDGVTGAGGRPLEAVKDGDLAEQVWVHQEERPGAEAGLAEVVRHGRRRRRERPAGGGEVHAHNAGALVPRVRRRDAGDRRCSDGSRSRARQPVILRTMAASA